MIRIREHMHRHVGALGAAQADQGLGAFQGLEALVPFAIEGEDRRIEGGQQGRRLEIPIQPVGPAAFPVIPKPVRADKRPGIGLRHHRCRTKHDEGRVAQQAGGDRRRRGSLVAGNQADAVRVDAVRAAQQPNAHNRVAGAGVEIAGIPAAGRPSDTRRVDDQRRHAMAGQELGQETRLVAACGVPCRHVEGSRMRPDPERPHQRAGNPSGLALIGYVLDREGRRFDLAAGHFERRRDTAALPLAGNPVAIDHAGPGVHVIAGAGHAKHDCGRFIGRYREWRADHPQRRHIQRGRQTVAAAFERNGER